MKRKRGFSQPAAVRDFPLEPEWPETSPFARHSGGGNSSHRSGLRVWFHFRLSSECRLGDRRRSFILEKFGGRFSRNAVNASLASAERTCAENSSFSSFTAAQVVRALALHHRLQAWSAVGGFAANF